MELFIRKPVVVEAQEWFPGREVKAKNQIYETDRWWFVLASGAALPLSPGDWLVRDPAGHSGFFPVPGAIFRASYEPIEGAEPIGWDDSPTV